jgi:hypothetical protein
LAKLPLAGFGVQPNFGYSLDSDDILAALHVELDLLQQEFQTVSDAASFPTSPWGPVVAILRELNDSDLLQTISSAAGLVPPILTGAADYSHKTRVRATLDWLGTVFTEADSTSQHRLALSFARELLRRVPSVSDQLAESLQSIGWQFANGNLIPVEVVSVDDLATVSQSSVDDLLKGSARLSYDPSGAINSACGAVDSATQSVYQIYSLGNAGADSFEKKVQQSLEALKLQDLLRKEVLELGWDEKKADELVKFVKLSLVNSAKVLEILRSQMGDAHGTKPVVPIMAKNSLRWATIISSFLANRS